MTTAVLIYAALTIATVPAVYLLGRAFDGWLGRQIDLDFSEPPTFDPDATPLGDAALADVLARRSALAAEAAS